MNYGMDRICRLDADQKKIFLHPVNRLNKARIWLHDRYHERPIQQDVFPEADAIIAWTTVTCCYSGIEQAMKCLLRMRGAYVDKGIKKGGHRHHEIGKLFKDLASEEQDVLRVSYAIYRSLHDYIPPKTVDCFLDAIDAGYEKWRYFLLEGGRPPTTHPGAMLEVWSASSDILKAKTFTNHGLQTVKLRIDHHLRDVQLDAFPKETTLEQINEMASWVRSDENVDINYYADVIYRGSNGQSVDTHEAAILCTLFDENKKSDNDFRLFLDRARKSRIVWNKLQDTFEVASR